MRYRGCFHNNGMILRMLLCSIAGITASHADAPGSRTETRALVLEEAVTRALLQSPQLATFEWDIRAAEARLLQAGLRPNPELSVTLENVNLNRGGETVDSITVLPAPAWGRETTSGVRGIEEAELTISIGYLFELGGKRAKRAAAAGEEMDVAQWDYELARAALVNEVVSGFIRVLAGQEREALAAACVDIARRVGDSVAVQVEAGEKSPIEHRRALVEVALAEIELSQAQNELEQARLQLAATWGATEPDFDAVAGRLGVEQALPSLEELLTRSEDGPYAKRWMAAMGARRAQVSQARSGAVPDITASVGLRVTGTGATRSNSVGAGSGTFDYGWSRARPTEDEIYGIVVGFSLPLPVFDRNQGNIREAEALLAKAGEEERASHVAAKSSLKQNWEQASRAYQAAYELEQNVLAQSARILEDIKQGHKAGKFTYLDLLEAERTRCEKRLDHLDRLEQYHVAVVEMETILGGGILHPWPSTNAADPQAEGAVEAGRAVDEDELEKRN